MKLLEMITGKKKPLTDADKARMNPALFKQEMAHRQNQSTSQAIGASIGDRATDGKEAYNLADLEMFEGTDAPDVQGQATAGTNATGLRSMMTPEMVPYLDMAENMAASGDAKGAMDIISKLQTDSGRSEDAKKYQRAQRQGYEGTFLEFVKEIRNANVTPAGTSMTGAEAKQFQVRLSTGDVLPVTDTATTLQDIKDGARLPEGAKYEYAPAAADKADTRKVSKAMDTVGVMRDKLFNPDTGIMNADYESKMDAEGPAWLTNRMELAWKNFSQDDPELAAYTNFSDGVLAAIAKSMGEAGALAEGDVGRSKGLVPQLPVFDPVAGKYSLGDTPAVSRKKLAAVEYLMKKWSGTQPSNPEESKADIREAMSRYEITAEEAAGDTTKPAGAMYEIYVDGKKTWADANGDPI